MANEWSMPAVRAFELLSPHGLGHVDRGDLNRYWGRDYDGAKTYAFCYSLYPGLLLSLHLGSGMADPPQPAIYVK